MKSKTTWLRYRVSRERQPSMSRNGVSAPSSSFVSNGIEGWLFGHGDKSPRKNTCPFSGVVLMPRSAIARRDEGA